MAANGRRSRRVSEPGSTRPAAWRSTRSLFHAPVLGGRQQVEEALGWASRAGRWRALKRNSESSARRSGPGKGRQRCASGSVPSGLPNESTRSRGTPAAARKDRRRSLGPLQQGGDRRREQAPHRAEKTRLWKRRIKPALGQSQGAGCNRRGCGRGRARAAPARCRGAGDWRQGRRRQRLSAAASPVPEGAGLGAAPERAWVIPWRT